MIRETGQLDYEHLASLVGAAHEAGRHRRRLERPRHDQRSRAASRAIAQRRRRAALRRRGAPRAARADRRAQASAAISWPARRTSSTARTPASSTRAASCSTSLPFPKLDPAPDDGAGARRDRNAEPRRHRRHRRDDRLPRVARTGQGASRRGASARRRAASWRRPLTPSAASASTARPPRAAHADGLVHGRRHDRRGGLARARRARASSPATATFTRRPSCERSASRRSCAWAARATRPRTRSSG